MIEGRRLRYYVNNNFEITLSEHWLSSTRLMGIYIPSKEILVRGAARKNPQVGVVSVGYEFFVKDKARKEYDELLKKLKTEPESISLPNCFIDWALANVLIENPPKEVREILPLD